MLPERERGDTCNIKRSNTPSASVGVDLCQTHDQRSNRNLAMDALTTFDGMHLPEGVAQSNASSRSTQFAVWVMNCKNCFFNDAKAMNSKEDT